MPDITNADYKRLVEDIYWLVGRADPTDADLRGAALQISWLIEQRAEAIAKDVATKFDWPFPLYGDKYIEMLNSFPVIIT